MYSPAEGGVGAPPDPKTKPMGPDTADSGELRDPAFDEWFRRSGYRQFGTDRVRARQWYDQRQRSAKPKVASVMDLMRMTMGA